MSTVKSGKIYWAKDVSTVNCCGEAVQKNRPVIVINNKQGLKYSGICTVIPLSTKVEKLEKTHCNVLVKSLNLKPSVTLTEQISTISQSALVGPPLDRLDENNLNLVKDAVKRQLGLC